MSSHFGQVMGIPTFYALEFAAVTHILEYWTPNGGGDAKVVYRHPPKFYYKMVQSIIVFNFLGVWSKLWLSKQSCKFANIIPSYFVMIADQCPTGPCCRVDGSVFLWGNRMYKTDYVQHFVKIYACLWSEKHQGFFLCSHSATNTICCW